MVKLFRTRVFALWLLLVIVPMVLARSIALPLVPGNAVASITPRELRLHLSFLASPELGGRYTFSAGNRIAARYLASQLESFGYHGAAHDGGFLQRIEFVANVLDHKATRLEIIGSQNGESDFQFGDDFYFPDPSSFALTAPVAFVGYGIAAPQQNYDDFAGLDLQGKILLVAVGMPKSVSPRVADQMSEMDTLLTNAQAHGALAVLFLPTREGRPDWAAVPSEFDDDRLKMVGEKERRHESSSHQIPHGEISPRLAQALLSSIKLNFSELLKVAESGQQLTPQLLPLSIKINLAMQQKRESTQNVVAILEGSDPKLKKEYLLLSAHYDHLKTVDDTVYCGADDDGSGTAAVLTIAHTLASGPPPKRSILIVFHTGEELGLYGSRYFTNVDPLVPLPSIVADLNVDMIGRSREEGKATPADRELTDKDSVYLIGDDKHSSELHHLSEQTNQELTGMHLDYSYNDESHPLRLFYRSDHYNYARKGIPVIFYFTGLHADYHRASDTIEKIDFDKMVRIARLIYATGWRIANLDHRLIVDRWKK